MESRSASNAAILSLSNCLTIQNAPTVFVDDIKTRLTIENPAWIENQKMGRWNGATPPLLRLYKQTDSGIIVPRGFAGQTISLCRAHELRFQIEDLRRTLPPVDFTFRGSLHPFQQAAVEAMLTKDFGTLVMPTGSGKTVVGLWLIAQRQQPALIVTHTKELLNQWVARTASFLRIPKEQIGTIGNGKKIIGQKITVATVQSLYKCAADIAPNIGFLVVDECHHTPARTFTDAVTAFDSKYVLGLSATPTRRDGLAQLIYRYVGDVVHKVEAAGLIETGNVLPFEAVTIETRFQTRYDASVEYTKMLSELTEDDERNNLIVDNVGRNSRDPGISLILSDRKSHCETLQALLERRGIRAEVLTGDRTGKERKQIVDRLNKGRVKILIATGALVGEGFDVAALTTLFIATPIRFESRLIQYIGRTLRPSPGKNKAVVFDFVDSHVGVLKAAARARQRVYQGRIERTS